jgi:hypothetical protein
MGETSRIVFMDLSMEGSEIVCQIDRTLPILGDESGDLYLTWNVTERPRDYEPIGDGVAFVLIPQRGYRRTNFAGKPDLLEVPKMDYNQLGEN